MILKLQLAVWQKATPVLGYDPNLFRVDDYGNPIAFYEYGKLTSYGWEIDHNLPRSKGGNNHINNLQPLHWRANRMKGDSLTF